MTLTDLCSIDEWTELERKITQLSNLDANVFGPDGYRITDYKHWANRLCPAVKDTDKGQSFICAVAHMNLSAQARQTGKTVIDACDAGLVKMVVPVFYGGEFLGAVGACGLLSGEDEVDDFLINKVTGIDEETIRELSGDLARISSDRLDAVIAVIQAEIEKIVRACRDKGTD